MQKPSPGTHFMTLRSTCDGSCETGRQIESTTRSTRSSQRRSTAGGASTSLSSPHCHHHHHHHQSNTNNVGHVAELSRTEQSSRVRSTIRHLEQSRDVEQSRAERSSRSKSKTRSPVTKTAQQVAKSSRRSTEVRVELDPVLVSDYTLSRGSTNATKNVNQLTIQATRNCRVLTADKERKDVPHYSCGDLGQNDDWNGRLGSSHVDEDGLNELMSSVHSSKTSVTSVLSYRVHHRSNLNSSYLHSSTSNRGSPAISPWENSERRSVSSTSTSVESVSSNHRMANHYPRWSMENGSAPTARRPMNRWTLSRPYGLDADLEENVSRVGGLDVGLDADLEENVSRVESQFAMKQEVLGRFRRKDLAVGSFLQYLRTGWDRFWAAVYMMVITFLRFDCLCLVSVGSTIKSVIQKSWKSFLPFFLLLLLLGAGINLAYKTFNQTHLRDVEERSAAYQNANNVWNFPYHFWTDKDGYDVTSEPPRPSEASSKSWFNTDGFKTILRQAAIQIYGKPCESEKAGVEVQSELNSKVEQLVQSLVQHEMKSFVEDMAEFRQWKLTQTTKDPGADLPKVLPKDSKDDSVALIAELANLRKEMGDFEKLVSSLKAELSSIKESDQNRDLDQNEEAKLWHRPVIDFQTREKLSRLERMLLEIKNRTTEIEGYMLDVKNCCRNQTVDMRDIKRQILAVLDKLPESDDAELQKWSVNIKEWLSHHFVSKQEMDQNTDAIREKITFILASIDLDKKIHSAVEEEVLKRVKIGGNGSSWQLESILKLVQEQIALFSADKTGLADYALESSGGSVISTRCSETYQVHTAQFSILGVPLWYHTKSPRTVIQPGVNPGECWAFKGSTGYVVIQLSGLVKISAVSLEHIPKSISPSENIDSAPKDFTVKGLDSIDSNGVTLGSFTYDQDGPSLQTFFLKDTTSGMAFPIVELIINSNHGNVDYTCLYRFRVHGQMVH